ncbi:hypothetical protein AgCh_017458 [Apium graveolens]
MLGRNEVEANTHDAGKLEAFIYPVKLKGTFTTYILNEESLSNVAYYILTNMPEVSPYITIFEEEVRSRGPNILTNTEIDNVLKTELAIWLQHKVEGNVYAHKRFKYLLGGPSDFVLCYKRCNVNGYAFNLGRSSSGVLVKGSCYGDDANDYYGTLQEILKVTYQDGNQVVLFRCHWYDHIRGVKKYKTGVITIDMNSKLQGGDVFILASQATQIYYAPSVKDPNSSIYTVIITRGRPIDESTSVIDEEVLQEDVSNATLLSFPMSLFVDFSQYQEQAEETYNGEEEEEEEEQEQEEEDGDEEEEDGYENLEEHDV